MSRWLRWFVTALGALVLLALLLAGGALWAVHRSVPTLDGDLPLAGLREPVTIRRDAIGTAVVQGANRLDVARGLGFVHAQERFFEMDLTRRSAAGELSALFGHAALERDMGRRMHRLRARLEARVAALDEADRALLQAYADGVNAGLAQLGARPWQYLLLRAQPEPWRPADSLLVVAEMYWKLQASSVDAGLDRALLRERVGDARFAWLNPRGGRWDAPLDGGAVEPPALPGPELFDVRVAAAPAGGASASLAMAAPETEHDPFDPAATDNEFLVGSNSWAVAGSRGADGAAMLANDMHLGLSAPSIWFRAQLEIGRGEGAIRAAGVTLPGLPALVVGANGKVAWGFTNAYGQWFDWIKVPRDAVSGRIVRVAESIAVKGEAEVRLDVAEFDGAPIVKEIDGQQLALRWVADQGEAYTLALDGLLGARDIDAALAIAHRCGMPQQNILIADRAGHVAWTIAGRLWAGSRADHYASFADPAASPPAWLPPDETPVVRDPADGGLWTANNRVLAGPGGDAIGDGGFDLGARAHQIRDRLAEKASFDEATLGAIQLDDEARFMRPWAERVAAAAAASPRHAEVVRMLGSWNGRADADQPAYRLVRAVRLRVLDALWGAWTAPLLGAEQASAKQRHEWHGTFEYSAELALDRRPPHLLPKGFPDWDAFLLAQVDAAVDDMTRHGQRPLAQATWGEINASRIRNVLSTALPALARFLDMPTLPQSGDANMPRVAAPSSGQSERLVVAPGHEDRATLTMPGGQSGHPMSPYYGAGHDTWAAGRTAPLLAGAAQHELSLRPGG
jgi:penicillin amidase